MSKLHHQNVLEKCALSGTVELRYLELDEENEVFLPMVDDSASRPIIVPGGIPLFGQLYSSLHVRQSKLFCNHYVLLALGAHMQRGLQYLSCVSVCLPL